MAVVGGVLFKLLVAAELTAAGYTFFAFTDTVSAALIAALASIVNTVLLTRASRERAELRQTLESLHAATGSKRRLVKQDGQTIIVIDDVPEEGDG